MTRLLNRIITTLACSQMLLSSLCAEPASMAPAKLCSQMKLGLHKAKHGCVALSTGGGVASAVVISPDGLVITAAHVASRVKEGKKSSITYENGTTAEVEVLGWNISTDIALFQITTPSEKPWPHVELAEKAPLTGSYCFTYAHPSGRLKGRPAQIRLGRIISHRIDRDHTGLLMADCNIQPGDSGGGLFSLDGKLIGIDSSAASRLGINLFPAIDQFHLDRKRLANKERWGEEEKSPANANNIQPKITNEVVKKVQAEFMRRLKLSYPPVIDFVMAKKKPDGTLPLAAQEIIDLMTREAIIIGLGQPLSFGLDDPALTDQLKAPSKEHTQAVAIYEGKTKLCSGLALNRQHIITKASLVKGDKKLTILHQDKRHDVKLLTTNKKWDLAIIKLDNKLPLPVIKWNATPMHLVAGDLLIAPDSKGRLLWGNATDAPRVVSKRRSIGPVDKSLISAHRAPYPIAIRNSLPLYAADAGTPVFDQNGQFVGMHIARFSRTMALTIPAEKLRVITKQMLVNKEVLPK